MKMATIFYCVEDVLSKAVVERLLRKYHGTNDSLTEILKRHSGKSKMESKSGFTAFCKAARRNPLLVLMDLDRSECPPSLRAHLTSNAWGKAPPPNMFFCVAETEIESWLIADRKGISTFIGISEQKISNDIKKHSKEYLLNLIKNSKNKDLKSTLIGKKHEKKAGNLYTLNLVKFVEQQWNPEEASKNSPSLNYIINKIKSIKYII